jgi:hypothetical protein
LDAGINSALIVPSKEMDMSKVAIACVLVMASVGIVTPAAAQECIGETAMVCGFVWNDVNNNGVQDPTETGIAGKTVTLSDGTDTFEAYTDDSGVFRFEDIPLGSFTLSISTTSIGSTAQPSPENATDDALDSDGTKMGPNSGVTLVVVSSFQKQDFDFGFYTPQAAIGTGTPGYWKNHPEAWPETIDVGSVPYDSKTAIEWLKKVGRDKTTTMFSSLVSAKLNILAGARSDCVDGVDGTISKADNWMALYGPVGSGVLASSQAWSECEPLHKILDDYNNGRLCAPHRN